MNQQMQRQQIVLFTIYNFNSNYGQHVALLMLAVKTPNKARINPVF